MLTSAEYNLLREIGNFSTIGAPTQEQRYLSGVPASQCQAFLLSSTQFVWFVEAWDVGADTDGKGRLRNKKLYPAKVTGLNLPSLYSGTLRWREETVSKLNLTLDTATLANQCFQPGFGQLIPADNNRAKKTVTITSNAPPISSGFSAGQVSGFFKQGALGRLLSIAAYVDPELAAEYDDEENQAEIDKSLNSINYQVFPPITYPAYTVYQPPSYYG